MFYHYFKSKDMLFDQVVESFFKKYREKFEALLISCENKEVFVKTFLPLYEKSMGEFGQLKGNIPCFFILTKLPNGSNIPNKR